MDNKTPIIVESNQPSELIEKELRKSLAKKILNGKRKYAVRTASGAFNDFFLNNPVKQKEV